MKEDLKEAKKKEKSPSIEEILFLLEEKIKMLEDKATPLEEGFRLYEEGMKLVKQVNDRIDRVEKDILILGGSGEAEE